MFFFCLLFFPQTIASGYKAAHTSVTVAAIAVVIVIFDTPDHASEEFSLFLSHSFSLMNYLNYSIGFTAANM